MTPEMNKLDNIEKKNPFTVPGNYFANFNAEIMTRLPEKKIHKAPRVSMWSKSRPWVYAAAMIAGVILIVRVATKNQPTETQQPTAASPHAMNAVGAPDTYWSNVSISEEEFYQYLEDQLIADGFYNYLYDELYHPAQNM